MTMIGSPKDSDTYKQLSEVLYGKEKIDERKRQNVAFTSFLGENKMFRSFQRGSEKSPATWLESNKTQATGFESRMMGLASKFDRPQLCSPLTHRD